MAVIPAERSESRNPYSLHYRMRKQYYVYILSSRKHGTLYIGVTNDLIRRVHQHRSKIVRGLQSDMGSTNL